MTSRRPLLVDDERQAREIRQTVRRVNGYWYQAGVPRKVRRRKAEELRDHLTLAVDDGQQVRDVVGADLPAFAADWAQADRRRPMLEPLLWLPGSFAGAAGLLALLGPSVFGHERTGVDIGSVAFVGSMLVLMFAIQLLRWQRHRLSSQRAAWVGVACGIGYTMLFFTVVPRANQAEWFVAVPPVLAWTLVGAALTIQGVLAWLKRTDRL